MSACYVVIAWPAQGEPQVVAQSDGHRFMCGVVGVEPGFPTEEEQREIDRAYEWGRDPRQAPPSGWRLFDLDF